MNKVQVEDLSNNNTIQEVSLLEESKSLKSSLKNWITFERNEIFLLLSYFFYGTAFANYEPYAPFWLMNLFEEHSFLILGLVMVIPSAIGVLGTSTWGFLADKFGTKKFVIGGMFAYVCMFFSLIFTTSSTYFLIAILIGTLFGSAQTANFYALGTKSVNKSKGLILAKITMTISLSWTIMSPVVGYIYDNVANSMIVQLIIAVVACSIAAVLILFVKEGKGKKSEKSEIVKTNKQAISKSVLITFGIILLVAFMFQATGGFWPYTSIYFLDVLEIKGSYYSLLLIIKTLLAVPLSFLLGNVKKTTLIASLVAIFASWSVVIFTLMTFFPNNWILILVIQTIPMYPLTNVSFYYLVTKFTPSNFRARAYGIFSAVGTAGYVSSILIVGAIADSASTGIYSTITSSLVICSFSLAFSIAFIIYTLINKRKLTQLEVEILSAETDV